MNPQSEQARGQVAEHSASRIEGHPKRHIRVAPRALVRYAADEVPTFVKSDGTLVFSDVSGFTAATEKLGRRGRIGAELMNELIVASFSGMLDYAESLGGDLLSFGGDALFLHFEGDGHAERGLLAAVGMRHALRKSASIRKSIVSGTTLGVSIGVHTGDVWLGVAGSRFPVLFPAGPNVSHVLHLEHLAQRGEILVSREVCNAVEGVSFIAHDAQNTFLVDDVPRSFRERVESRAAVAFDGFDDQPATFIEESSLVDPSLAPLIAEANVLEHREGSVGFVRCLGLDALSDSERLLRIVQLVEQTAREAERQGVCIIASDVAEDGVKLFLAAGLPVVRGEDADRLVTTLRAAVNPLDDVALSAGAYAGPLVAGFVGSRTRRVFTGMGDVVNTAARIAANAGPGEVAIGDPLADRLRSGWQLRVRAPFAAKGKKSLVRSRAVVDHLAPKSSVTATLPFVGRADEVNAIRRVLGTPDGWIEIAGPPGAGKSRLVSETVISGVFGRTLNCFGDPTATESPYQAIAPVLLQWIVGTGDPALVGARRLDALLVELRRNDPDLTERLAGPIRRVFGVEGRHTDSTVVDRRMVHRGVIEVLRLETAGPVALVVEDAHWIDASSAELILAIRNSTLDVRIVSTRRLDGDGLKADERATERIVLPGIEDSALTSAARVVANEVGIPRVELDALITRAEGNPLVLELLIDARSRGMDADALPPRAEELAGRLLDSLLPIHRHLLGIAAVCGAGCDLALVARVAGIPEHQVESQFQALAELAELDPEDGKVRFRHALVRDAAYARLPFRERFSLHAKAADIFERTRETFDDTPLLAFHFHRAGDHAKAWRYGVEAGTKARAADAPLEAAANYRRALENAVYLNDLAYSELVLAWECLGVCEQRNGKPAEADKAFRTAFELTQLVQAELLRERGRLAADTRRLAQATRWYAKAQSATNGSLGRREEQFRTGLAIDLAAVRYRQGKFKFAETTLRDAIRRARHLRDDPRLAHGLYLLASVSAELARPESTDYGREAAGLFERMGDKLGLARTLNNLGVVHQLTGEWDEARAFYQRSASAYLSAGDDNGAAIIQNNLAEILSDQGHYDEARVAWESALETWSASRFSIGIALATSNLGRLAGRELGNDDGRALLERAADEFSALGGWDFVFEARLRLSEHALRIGDTERVYTLLRDLPVTMTEAAALPGRAAQLHRLLGLAAAMEGNVADSVPLLRQSLADGERAQNVYEQACTALAIASLEIDPMSSVDHETAEKHRRLAHEWFDRLGVETHARRPF